MNACRLLAGCVTIALCPMASSAQACRGRPGFSRASVVASAGAMAASDARSTSVGLTVGSHGEGLVASIAGGYVVREASPTFVSEQTGTSLGASLAYAGTEFHGRLELCPGLGISQIKVTGEFISGDRTTLTQTSRRAGVSAGYTLAATPSLRVIPFATVEYVRFGGSLTGNGVNLPVPEDSYVPVTAGLGAVLHERFGLTGSVTVPTGLPTRRRLSFVMSLSAAIGHR